MRHSAQTSQPKRLPHPKAARKKAGLTWRALRDKAHVGLATIHRCEISGEYPPNPSVRAAYLAALGLSEAN